MTGNIERFRVDKSTWGQVDEVVAGAGISVDASDPERPVISAEVTSENGLQIKFMTAAAYADLLVKDPNVLYLIVG